ncbi:MAG: hypothetical protein ACRYGA_07935 [Janthinobacterium lividum]
MPGDLEFSPFVNGCFGWSLTILVHERTGAAGADGPIAFKFIACESKTKACATARSKIDMHYHSMENQRPRCGLIVPSLLALVITALAPATGAAQIATPTWNLSGFGTLGVVDRSGGGELRFSRNSTQRGPGSRLSALPDSRLGLQVDWDPGGGWEGAVQGVWLPRPSGTPMQQSIESAYLGYRFWPDTRVRIGRMSPDIFLFADSRSIGFALPWARPPVDFYGFVPLASIDGIDVDQHWYSGESTWRARASAGLVQSSVTDIEGSRVSFKGHDTWAVSLTREEGGLQTKASYIRTRARTDIGSGVAQLRQGLADLSQLPVPGLADRIAALSPNLWDSGDVSYLSFAVMYETGPWTLISEAGRTRAPGSPLSASRAYVSAGYRQGMVTYYGLASRVRPDRAAIGTPAFADTLGPVIGEAGAQQAQALAGYAVAAGNNYRYDQQTFGVGLRWDFKANAALKLQVDRFDVKRNGSAGWRYSDGRATRGMLVSVLVDFVWGQ